MPPVRGPGLRGGLPGGKVVGAFFFLVVLFATGSAARQTLATKDRPCDAVVMAIVDSWEVGGDELYHKYR